MSVIVSKLYNSGYLLVTITLFSSPPWFPPLPDTLTAGASSTLAAAATTTITTMMTTSIRTSVLTTLASAAFAVTLAHASTIPSTQPNLRPRQSANNTIQWQPCAKAPATSECALFTYVFHILPSQINMPTLSLYQQRSTRLCKTRRWNYPDRHDTLRSANTPSQRFHLHEPRFAPSRRPLC